MSEHQLCKKCDVIKPLSEFNRQKSCVSGYRYECRACQKKRYTDWYDPKIARNYNLKTNYGITTEDFNLMFENQQGKCLGCDRHQSELKRVLCVDHNKITGKVRGLLCDPCNRAFGLIYESAKTLNNLIKYAEKDQENTDV